jgi:hypothetical protein
MAWSRCSATDHTLDLPEHCRWCAGARTCGAVDDTLFAEETALEGVVVVLDCAIRLSRRRPATLRTGVGRPAS